MTQELAQSSLELNDVGVLRNGRRKVVKRDTLNCYMGKEEHLERGRDLRHSGRQAKEGGKWTDERPEQCKTHK